MIKITNDIINASHGKTNTGIVPEMPSVADESFICSPDYINVGIVSMQIEKKCQNCNKIFNIHSYRRETAKFCSNVCFKKYRQRKNIFIKCEFCGKEKLKRPCEIESEHLFCSNTCRNSWMKGRKHSRKTREKMSESQKRIGNRPPQKGKSPILIECSNCGTKFKRRVCCIRRAKYSFCSNECKFDWFQGEKHPHWRNGQWCKRKGPGWLNQRRKALRRDDHTCQICGTKETDRGLDVHHIIPFIRFENYIEANKIDNLVTLCRACHGKIEFGGENFERTIRQYEQIVAKISNS